MKLKLAIILGFISWLLVMIISVLINPLISDSVTYIPIIIPISIIIVTALMGTVYIREINKKQTIEGFKLGIIFLIIDIICDLLIKILTNTHIILLNDYKVHIIYTIILTPIITTILGYLAEIEIKLE